MLNIFITLTEAGLDTGPFNLLSNVDGFTVPFEENILKADLLDGYVSNLVPDFTTIIRVQSINDFCGNYVDIVIEFTTTTTSSTSTTTSTTTSP